MIIETLFGLLMAVLAYLAVDTLKRLRHLETTSLRRSDLLALQTQLESEHEELKRQLRAEHTDNRHDIGELTKAIRETHKRIDDFLAAQAARP